MDNGFSVEYFAMHLVNRQLADPRYCKQAFTLADFKDPEDRLALEKFFTLHLDAIWGIEESKRTRAAVFDKGAKLQSIYAEILKNSDCFYNRSCEIGKELLEKSRSTSASIGVLMILWVKKIGKPSPYMVLLKLDPGPSDLVGLESAPDGAMIMDLVVHHIEQTLPTTEDRVLKWAVLPHPNRPDLDVKVRDEQGRDDLARYFMNFVCCTERPSQKEQASGLLEALEDTAEQAHPDLDIQPILQEVYDSLVGEEAVTPEVVIAKVKDMGKLPNFMELTFREKLTKRQAGELNLPGKVLSKTKVEYRLSNGITIRGSWSAVENLVQVHKLDGGGYEFTIQAPSYVKKHD